MSDPISVLLIIGAATIGPIDSHWVNDESRPSSIESCRKSFERPSLSGQRAMLSLCENNPVGFFGPFERRPEILPELCERAMKEIGAEKILRFAPFGPHKYGLITPEKIMREEEKNRVPTEEWWVLMPTGKLTASYSESQYQVRCIPTPSGYRGGQVR